MCMKERSNNHLCNYTNVNLIIEIIEEERGKKKKDIRIKGERDDQ